VVIRSKPMHIIGPHLSLHNKCISARAVWNFEGAFDCSEKWWIHRIFACCYRRWILVFISLPIHSLLYEITRGGTIKNEDNNCSKKSDGDHIFHWHETKQVSGLVMIQYVIIFILSDNDTQKEEPSITTLSKIWILVWLGEDHFTLTRWSNRN
jgi:hypothetical protein